MRFSPFTTRRDWTNEVLAEIRALYNKYSDASASTKLNLQGVIFDAKEGGRLPVRKILVSHARRAKQLSLGPKNDCPSSAGTRPECQVSQFTVECAE